MPRRGDRAAPAGGVKATGCPPAWVRLRAAAGAVPITTVAGMIATTVGTTGETIAAMTDETIDTTVGMIGATTAAKAD